MSEQQPNNFVTPQASTQRKAEPQVENLNQNHNNRLVAQEIAQEKQENRVRVQGTQTLEVDWGEKGNLNGSNRGFQLLR